MDLRSVQHVGIVGAGVAGLATAKTLQAEGLDCTIFERAERLGGVWADGYSNFGVQVPKELYQFPDWPLPEGTEEEFEGEVLHISQVKTRAPLDRKRVAVLGYGKSATDAALEAAAVADEVHIVFRQ